MKSAERELTWLERNRRFLKEAQDPKLALLERVKRLASFSADLDEFFMVRVAELQRRARAGDRAGEPGGSPVAETLAAVLARVHELVDEQHRCFLDEIQPLLASEGIFLLRPKEAGAAQRRFLQAYVRRSLLPVLTPLAIDSGQPFPFLGNGSLSLVVSIRPSAASVLPHTTLSLIHIPGQAVQRFVALPAPAGLRAFMLLEDVIRLHLPTLYAGYEIVSSHAIRVTRSAGLQRPKRAQAARDRLGKNLQERRLGAAVRLQHDGDPPPEVLTTLLSELELSPADVFEGEGFAAFSDLSHLYAAVDLPGLEGTPQAPSSHALAREAPDA